MYSLNLFSFARKVLGYTLLEEYPHLDWANELDKRYPRSLRLEPRHTFKSTIITKSYPIWRLLENPNLRILLVNATAENAEAFLSEIVGHLLRNRRLLELYHALYHTHPLDIRAAKTKSFVLHTRTRNFSEPSIGTVGALGNLVSAHYDLIIVDDLCNKDDRESHSIREKKKRWYKDLVSVLSPDGELVVVGCLAGDTNVLLDNNSLCKIADLKPGQHILSFDQSKNALSSQKILALIPQGDDETFELKTGNSSIVGNANHPFLRVVPTKTWGAHHQIIADFVLSWTTLKNLKPGDLILSLKSAPSGSSLSLPNGFTTSDDFLWLFGFLTGDGWIVNHPNQKGSMRWLVHFALGTNDELNLRVLDLFEKIFHVRPSQFQFRKRTILYRLNKVGRLLQQLGMKKGASNKDIPSWIFALPLSQRISFIRGLLAADGHKESRGFGYSIEVCSEKLIFDLRHLASISSCRTSNVYHRDRLSQPPHSPSPLFASSFSTRIYFDSTRFEHKFSPFARAKLPPTSVFGLQQVTSISPAGNQPVFDLTIQGTKNFIANQFVVHNTPWHFDDVYAWLIKELNPQLPDDFKYHIYRDSCFLDDEVTPRFPNILSAKKLATLKIEKGVLEFSSQYLLKALPQEFQIFKLQSMYTLPQSSIDLHKAVAYGFCDPTLGVSDFSAIVTLLKYDNHWIVFHADISFLPHSKTIDKIISLHSLFHYKSFGIEANSIGKAKNDRDYCNFELVLRERQALKNVTVPYKLIWHTVPKATRIQSIESYFSDGQLRFLDSWNQEYPLLIEQLIHYPLSHDDGPDALSGAVSLLLADEHEGSPILYPRTH